MWGWPRRPVYSAQLRCTHGQWHGRVGPAGKIGSWASIPNRDLETVAPSFLGMTFKEMASGPGSIELFQAGIWGVILQIWPYVARSPAGVWRSLGAKVWMRFFCDSSSTALTGPRSHLQRMRQRRVFLEKQVMRRKRWGRERKAS